MGYMGIELVSPEIKEKGVELLKRYDAYHPILRYKPER